MKAESEYVPGDFHNALKNLDDGSILQIIRLSLASNDLISNFQAISHFPSNESGYFFYNSISIVREVAKLVREISRSRLKSKFSQGTLISLSTLEGHLSPFDIGPLSKSTLKPIRDVNFHYKFPNISTDEKLSELFEDIKSMDKLTVGVKPINDDLLSIRYSYADWFRTEYFDSHLSSESVHTISGIAVEIIAFLDSLIADLMEDSSG